MTPTAGSRGTAAARPLGLLLGYVADLAFGDPRRGHPVAGLGQAMAALERPLYVDHRPAGALHVGLAVGIVVSVSAGAERLLRGRPVLHTVVTAAATWAVLGGRSLRAEAAAIDGQLRRGDLPAARVQITHLVGRDPSTLDDAGIARACVESVAENTSDAVVGPLVWGALAGLPGLVGYRTINTLDAMIGHRSQRYLRFGWAAARLDDIANLLPSRVSAAVVLALAPLFGGSTAAAWRVVRRDAGRHPSPNAGPVEAAFAGALGLTLGGVNTYGNTVEDRGTLGDGPSPRPADIPRAARLSAAVGGVSAGLAVLVAAITARCRRW
jgi:adenosylcobinamide-phosphate synthase